MQISSRILTSSEILDLRNTPIEIVSAQGSGLYIVPCFILLRSKKGTDPFQTDGYGEASFNLFCNSLSLLISDISLSYLDNKFDDTVSYFQLPLNHFLISDLDNQGLFIKITKGLLDPKGGELEILTTYEVYNV